MFRNQKQIAVLVILGMLAFWIAACGASGSPKGSETPTPKPLPIATHCVAQIHGQPKPNDFIDTACPQGNPEGVDAVHIALTLAGDNVVFVVVGAEAKTADFVVSKGAPNGTVSLYSQKDLGVKVLVYISTDKRSAAAYISKDDSFQIPNVLGKGFGVIVRGGTIEVVTS